MARVSPQAARRWMAQQKPSTKSGRRLGNGNISAGVRLALEMAAPDENTDPRAPAGHQRKRTP